ncbi:hypothetical protein C9374_013283 [Naegleria lovaniensis]|uniref:Uncharacterized protein n=1 Tax=Naegleria lovaniensis TaxID=51637 RepID=A0AA88GZ18_NAELO|nr:uncharacterized protein C9374_013283 [Naegleria lovaniensis]KAG2391798.1 hypothetical protein C9374_013283 [Naegleria lovaniensis]
MACEAKGHRNSKIINSTFSPYPLIGLDLGTKYIGVARTVKEKYQDSNNLQFIAQNLMKPQFSNSSSSIPKYRVVSTPMTAVNIFDHNDSISRNNPTDPQNIDRARRALEEQCSRYGIKGVVAGYQKNFEFSDQLLHILRTIFVQSELLSSLPILLQNESRSSLESYMHVMDKKSEGMSRMEVIDAFKNYKKDIYNMNQQEKQDLNSQSAAVILDRAIRTINTQLFQHGMNNY